MGIGTFRVKKRALVLSGHASKMCSPIKSIRMKYGIKYGKSYSFLLQASRSLTNLQSSFHVIEEILKIVHPAPITAEV